MERKRCIFHIPNHIDISGSSGSQVRPLKMLHAFENIGYDVAVVMGYGEERKKSIKEIKRNINLGIKYDFLYSESSTMPTLLTEKNHLPVYPLLDFGFMNFCKKKGIKVGLFYRDIHWKFEQYKSGVPKHQRMLTIPMYKYDLYQYNRIVDILYLPTLFMSKYVPNIKVPIKTLPPGAVSAVDIAQKKTAFYLKNSSREITIFYVGGVRGIYDLTILLRAIRNIEYIKMIICCREKEWNEYRHNYEPYLTERVEIIHKTGKDLAPYYLKCDLCCCYLQPGEYVKMGMPIKLLEYTSYLTPVIATKGTSAGTFVEKYDCGFSIPYGEEYITDLLEGLYKNKSIIKDKHDNMKKCLEKNTWEQRAVQVANDLSEIT